MRYVHGLSLSLLFVVGAGCETFTPPTQRLLIEKDKAMVMDTVATRRGTYLFKREETTTDGVADPARWVLVSEPPPDVAMASAVKAALEAALKTPAGVDVSGKGSLEVTQTLTKLVERTQAVTVLRDAMFRLSEGYANGTLSRKDYNDKFTQVLAFVERIAKAQEDAAQTDKQAAENHKQSLENDKKSLELRHQLFEKSLIK